MLRTAATLSAPARADSTLHVLVVGDSTTVGYQVLPGWRGQLQALIEQTEPVQIDMLAAGGWSTADAYPPLAAALLATRPDLVFISIGTNDTNDVAGFAFRYDRMLSTVLDMSSAKIAAAFIQYSTANYPTLAQGEAAVNDAIFSQLYARGFLASPPPPRFAGLANFQDIQSLYLDHYGIHPTSDGYTIYAHKIYDAIHGALGLPDIPYAYPPLTGARP